MRKKILQIIKINYILKVKMLHK